MPLDAVTLGAVSDELNTLLCGARIEKVHQPEKDEIVLLLKTSGGAQRLVISASSEHPRIHITKDLKENPIAPPMFCMLLRKHLTGAKINSITRMGFERAVDINFLTRNELGDITTRHLICEIMGRNSNIILLDENEKIIDSIKHVDLTVSTVRNILPGLKYMLPPDNKERLNPDFSTKDDYYNLIKNAHEGREPEKEIVSGVMGISPLLAGECVYRAVGERKVLAGELDDEKMHLCAEELEKMFKKAKNGEITPCIIIDKTQNRAVDFAPFLLMQYGEDSVVIKESLNEALYEFYHLRDLQAHIKNRSSNIIKVINNNLNRAQKKLDILQKELALSEKREEYRIWGDLISANLHRIKKGDRELVCQNFYEENAPECVITLDTVKTPSQNAQSYYKKYKKAKNTQINATVQIEKTVEEIKYLESVLYSVTNSQSPSDLTEIREELIKFGYIKNDNTKKHKEKQTQSKPMEFECDGYTIFVGKNNTQNDYLTLRIGKSRDLWLHTKNIPGSHVLVKYMGEDFPNNVIESAAKLAAFYSKGKNSSYVEVDYCPVSHVRKPSGAKSGMVIYEGYNTALVNPDEELAEKLRK